MTPRIAHRPEEAFPFGALVIGGGVGGMRAAIDLAEAGIHTYLLENTPSLGGRVAQLGYMFPTHDCVLCRGTSDHGFGCTRPSISPAFLDHNLHPNITLLTSSDLVSCEGTAGDFRVQIRKQPEFVDPSRCINCGRCAEVCPQIRPSGFQLGLSTRKAIDKSAPRSIPNAYYLLEHTDQCEGCRRCMEVCPTDAIDLEAEATELELHVGVVILAMGFQPFNAAEMPELGFGRIPDVITSMQYERLASRSGPTEGIVRRISDGATPQRIAWLQCVGSRDQRHPYCSSICCMYATKEAILAKQRIPGVDCHIFTMDERAFNKEYNKYYREAQAAHGIRYDRCRISSVSQDPDTGEILLRYPTGRKHGESAPGQGPVREERFDLLVLAVGIRPPAMAVDIAAKLGIDLNEYGFCETDKFAPLHTSRPGVFVCGAFTSPKEIAETILDASGAAAGAMQVMRDHLGEHPFTRADPYISMDQISFDRDLSRQDARILVALCECAGEISNTVDLQALAEFARGLPGVCGVEIQRLACSPAGERELVRWMFDHAANRLVVAACSHRTHEPFFQRLIHRAGLNPYLMELVNLREHCAWVHPEDRQGATRVACELLRMGIERVAKAEPLHKDTRSPQKAALVIGGGVAGMTSALAIADTGFDVHLVEATGELGGNLHHIHYVAEGDNPQRLLRDLVNRIVGHERITLHLNSQVVHHSGSVGDFRARVRTAIPGRLPLDTSLRHGVAILATGGVEAGGECYSLGKDPRILRQSELEEIIAHQPERASNLRSVVMIQCVQADEGMDYCSRICCTNTLKNALRLKLLNPDCQVVILYKNIITYGFREKYYLEARRRGVLFVRYTDDEPPQVMLGEGNGTGSLKVSIEEHIFGHTLVFEPDLVALSMAVKPSPGTAQLARLLGVKLSPEGFLHEAHLKMRPMDFADDGIFLAGMAHFPKFIEETITHALACAGRALTVLTRAELQLGGVVAVVDPERCTGCLTCVRTCPFSIPEVRSDLTGIGGLGGAAWIDPARCHGCGTCTADCPAKAIQLLNYRDEQFAIGLGAWHVPRPILTGERVGP